MPGDPHHTAAKPGPSPREPRCDDLDLHRIDLAARLLAFKQPSISSESLIVHTSADVGIGTGGLDVALFIGEMIRISGLMPGIDDGARSLLAAERMAELRDALSDPVDIAALRGLRRRGELERPLPLTAQRRIRRACWLMTAADTTASTLEPLSTVVWDELLDTLARSLAYDREGEVWSDVALDGLDDRGLAGRRERVRQAIVRGERSPVTPGRPRPATDDIFEHTVMATGAAWPPPERELLPAGHRVGRFTLLQRLGVGAMGVVYAAYDPELDRRIAVKLLRTRQGPGAARAQARLLREAQAMARLAHPNVAVVHDVGTHEGDVFVAMEFIRGATLHGWLRDQPRTWREVVDVFMQAGRGLAAAHAAGLVHRDFKPSNAMIGDDGRVRVLDFGLCYTETAADRDGLADSGVVASAVSGAAMSATSLVRKSSPNGQPEVRITRREEVVGTPAYMPPEQFRHNGLVGPASDQFSFCASLYEALYGQLPFAGETLHEVALSISRGDLRSPPRSSRVPGWLHSVVQRGLRIDPQQRFPSMDLLLRALERGRVRARGGVMVAAALALGTGLGGFWAARSQSASADPCSGAASQMAEVWSPELRVSTERALVVAGPAFAEELWPRVSSEIDRYADTWQDNHREACKAHQRGENSDTLLDHRMACLERRRTALREAVNVLAEGGEEVALHALEVVSRLPALDPCNDLVALEADAAPSSDPAVLVAIEAQRPRLERVQSLEHAGQPAAAVSLADEVVEAAEKIGDRRLLAEALLQRGRLEINRLDHPKDQEELLTRAYLKALGGRLDELATEALALRMYYRGREDGRAALALDDLAVASEMVARLPSPDRVNGLVLNNAGTAYMASGDVASAAIAFRQALKLREATLGPEHLEVANTLFNLALVSGENDRMALLERALRIFDRQLGKAHPQTLEVRLAASMFAVDPREARALIEPGCQALTRFSSDPTQQARCIYFLGHHTAESGDARTAALAFEEAARLLPVDVDAPFPMPPQEIAQLRARAALGTGQHTAAIELLRRQLATKSPASEPWQRRQRAELELLLGQHLERVGDRPGALAALSNAVAHFEGAAAGASDVVLQQRLAGARLALATHLLAGTASGPQRERAADLLAAAEQWYRAAGDGYAWRLDQLAAVRRKAI